VPLTEFCDVPVEVPGAPEVEPLEPVLPPELPDEPPLDPPPPPPPPCPSASETGVSRIFFAVTRFEKSRSSHRNWAYHEPFWNVT
jgi:hypothetical protein